MAGPLGRLKPPDWEHVRQFPLAALPAEAVPKGKPSVLGIYWYSRFDDPVKDSAGRWWAATDAKNLGSIRGGHAICVKPGGLSDAAGWWAFYDQGQEGACVGFSESRMMSLYNRTRYKGQWLYDEARKIDGIGGFHEGTTVRAGMEILRTRGHERAADTTPRPGDGIAAYRWMQTVDELHTVLALPLADKLGAVPLLNSWGEGGYPHIVWMPDDVVARLLSEDGEASVATDR